MKVVPYPFQGEGVQQLRYIEWQKFRSAIELDLRRQVHKDLWVNWLRSHDDFEADEELVCISIVLPGVAYEHTDNMEFLRIPLSLIALTPEELKQRLVDALKSLVVMLRLML